MLSTLRKQRKSIVGIFIVAVCALLMLGFGVDLMFGNRQQTAAARVGDSEISFIEYQRFYNNYVDRMRSQYGENFEQIRKFLDLEQQAMDTLITQKLLENFTNDLGLTASLTQQIPARIQALPYFAERGLTPQSYQAFLRTVGLSGEMFEQEMTRMIVQEQLQNILSQVNALSTPELRSGFVRDKTKYNFRFVKVSSAELVDAVDMSNETAIEEFYQENQETFRKPKAVKYTFVKLAPTDFEKSVEIAEEDLEIEYEQRKQLKDYQEPRRVQLRQIMLPKVDVQEKGEEAIEELLDVKEPGTNAQSEEDPNRPIFDRAEELVARIESGEDFQKLAAEVSSDPQAAEAEWLTYVDMDPSIAQVVRDLDVQEHSGVIELPKSFVIVSVADAKEARVKTLDEVRDDLEREIRQAYAAEYAFADAEDFLVKWKTHGSSLRDYASSQEKKVYETGRFFSEGEVADGGAPNLTEKVIQLGSGARELVVLEETPFIIETNEIQPSRIPELNEVRKEVEESYRSQQITVLAKEKSEAVLADLRAGGSSKELARNKKIAEGAESETDQPEDVKVAADTNKEPENAETAKDDSGKSESLETIAPKHNLKPRTINGVTRTTAVGELFTSPEIKQAAFTLSEQNPYPDTVFQVGQDFYVFELMESIPPPASEFEAARAELLTKERNAIGNGLFLSVVQSLKANVDIWVNETIYSKNS